MPTAELQTLEALPPRCQAERQLLELLELLQRHLDDEGSRYDSSARRLLAELASVISEAHGSVTQLSARLRALESLAVTDGLTGLLNRRGFDRELQRALARAARHGERGLLVLGDLNHFKGVNDCFGHAAGDAVLQEVARLLDRHTRASDLVARLGGDEFAVLMTASDPAEARLRWREVERRINQQVLRWQGRNITLSASFGAADYGAGEQSAALLQRADDELYRRKGLRLVYAAAS